MHVLLLHAENFFFVAQKFVKESGAMLGKNFMIKYIVNWNWCVYTPSWYSLNQ